MTHANENVAPVKARVVVVDSATWTVVWANEAVADAFPDSVVPAGTLIEQVLPLAVEMGVPGALRTVAMSGEARHFQTELVSTGRGNVTMVTSVYRLPDGSVLVVTENAWQWTPPDRDDRRGRSRRPSR